MFINGHIALNNSNKVSVIAAHPSGARFLYPVPQEKIKSSTESGDRIQNGHTMYRQFRQIDGVVLDELYELLNDPNTDASQSSAVSGALSLALTHINRVADVESMSARIFLLSVTGNLASQYIGAMNCVFAAQKKHVPIDVCKLNGDTVFLQQACDSTQGTYMKISDPKGLIQYLMSAFSVDPSLRGHVNLATEKDVDFRAVCFLTDNVVDIGFVCSVCLCIMSRIPPNGECPMCGTQYDSSLIADLSKKPVVKKKAKKKKKLDGSTPGTPGTPTMSNGSPAPTSGNPGAPAP